jgi:hypothetical protein
MREDFFDSRPFLQKSINNWIWLIDSDLKLIKFQRLGIQHHNPHQKPGGIAAKLGTRIDELEYHQA